MMQVKEWRMIDIVDLRKNANAMPCGLRKRKKPMAFIHLERGRGVKHFNAVSH